jgi:uncharacterized protein (DUF1778 family)
MREMTEAAKNRKLDRVELRVTPLLRKMVRRAAQLEGRTVSDFATSALEAAAQKAIADHEIMVLSLEAQEQFFAALSSPPEPNSNLQRIVRASRALDK